MKRKIYLTVLLFAAAVILGSALTGWVKKPGLVDPDTIARAADKGLRLLEKSDYIFSQKGHCVSCHHNILTEMAWEIARKKGIPVTDSLSVQCVMGMVQGINVVYNDNKVGNFITAKFIGAYVLLGLQAAKYPADANTDLAVNYLLGQSRPDGSFGAEAMRVPLESGEIHLAAITIKGIMEYAPASKRDQAKEAVDRTRKLLEISNPGDQQEMAFQLMGLQWTSGNAAVKSVVAKKLLSIQHPDGGWSQLSTMPSDAYATGEALYALYISGQLKPEDEKYQQGIRYLLKTQDDEGAWEVLTRSSPIQPFFTSGFPPYDENQFISAAASNWAIMALLNALPDE
jgi:hypothetical protein